MLSQLTNRLLGRVKLPTELSEYDLLVDKVFKKYNLKDKLHCAALISVAIRQIPNNQAYTSYKFLGESVMKNLANYIANYKGETLKHESQVRALVDIIKQEPLNQEAWDNLQKAADNGSEQAKKAILDLETDFPQPGLKVVSDVATTNIK
jgi:hypothetical protein